MRKPQASAAKGAPRLRQANRTEIELRACGLESLLSQEHRARLVWRYVVRQDLGTLPDTIKARGSNAGRARLGPPRSAVPNPSCAHFAALFIT